LRICYVLLSPTPGMHQYTADLANRMVRAGHDVHLVTTVRRPRDRYAPRIAVHCPANTVDRGLSFNSFQPFALRRSLHAIRAARPDVVHFTGPHLWNLPLMVALTRRDIPLVHTLHDLHPHVGEGYGRLLHWWNEQIARTATQILVHGRCYREELLERGVDPSRLIYTPLTHLFTSYAQEQALMQSLPPLRYEPWGLFFARLEPYKGLNVLVEAAGRIKHHTKASTDLIIAGRGKLEDLVREPVPANIEVRNRFIGDEEAVNLFSRCGVVVLPYIEASQSALVAAAYFFQKPVVVSRVGALPEYVDDGETGWVVPPNDSQALAQTLQMALSDPARLARMGMSGRAWYERQRSAEDIILQARYGALARTCEQEPTCFVRTTSTRGNWH
jgi:glycosyltransferase involved in cell wall biosynthesis